MNRFLRTPNLPNSRVLFFVSIPWRPYVPFLLPPPDLSTHPKSFAIPRPSYRELYLLSFFFLMTSDPPVFSPFSLHTVFPLEQLFLRCHFFPFSPFWMLLADLQSNMGSFLLQSIAIAVSLPYFGLFYRAFPSCIHEFSVLVKGFSFPIPSIQPFPRDIVLGSPFRHFLARFSVQSPAKVRNVFSLKIQDTCIPFSRPNPNMGSPVFSA